ncbi:MAG TPA: DUF4168 domain-containing protein [Rhodanobacteraceae bacterium]|nr:DUF4168 domain-containing protein [Rhodanobacteraceae bacterium]
MTHPAHQTSLAAAVALASALLAPAVFAAQTPAPAQQAPTTSSAPTQADTGPAPTDAELQHFARAAEDVIVIRKATEPKLAAAKDQTTRTQLQQGAEKQMETAIQQQHLSVQRYEQIAMVVQTDSTLRAKVMKLMETPQKS